MDLTTTHTTGRRRKTYSGISKRSCPDCAARLVRIARRPVDRLSSLFVPVKRYRCRTFMCGWEGNLLWSAGTNTVASGAGVDGVPRPESGSGSRRTPMLIAASFALVAGAIALVFLLASTGFQEASEATGVDGAGAGPVGFAGAAQPGPAREPPSAAVVRPPQVTAAGMQ